MIIVDVFFFFFVSAIDVVTCSIFDVSVIYVICVKSIALSIIVVTAW